MVQKKYSVHKISVEVQTEPTTVIQTGDFSATPKRNNPRTPQYIAASTGRQIVFETIRTKIIFELTQ